MKYLSFLEYNIFACISWISFLDLAVIPDFATGAMENWGLITYRETAILYDPIETSTVAHQYVAIVIAHELAHQWFGNLVTMKWWNDLWLNEGFASYLEYLGVENLFPDWKMMEQFILDKTQPALALDALSSSHPISVDVVDPAEIEAIFDTISYSKVCKMSFDLPTKHSFTQKYVIDFKSKRFKKTISFVLRFRQKQPI